MSTLEMKIQALSLHLDNTVEELEIEQTTYNENEFETIEGNFLVLTDDEADEEVKSQIESLIDEMGISAFTPSFQETIIDEYMSCDWFDETMEESYEYYANDIENEIDGEDEEGNEITRLQTEMEEINVDTKEDFVQYLCDNELSGMDWYKCNFGEEEFNGIIKDHGTLDIDGIVQDCIDMDGRGHNISHYDGEENEIDVNGEMLYIYRIN